MPATSPATFRAAPRPTSDTSTPTAAAGRPATAETTGTTGTPGSTGTAPQPARRSLISGPSLAELLASAGAPEPSEEERQPATAAAIDPRCAEKLGKAREAILQLMQERRPRFVPAFEQMELHDNVIRLSVPTQELREEMLRNKTGMLMRIAELAGVAGMIELEIAVNERIRAARPIKLEDRMKYIADKNPLVAELRRALDLEAE